MRIFRTNEVDIGGVPLGGANPIRIQSMVNTPTLDAPATVAQSIRMIEAGCEYVRITAQSVKEAEHLAVIKKGLRQAGFRTPIIADVHFNAQIALTAARIADKVRINPGNYAERNVGKVDFTMQEYLAGIEKIRENIKPLLDICKKYGTALRIGSNQGSLSERIVSRYGDTPEGMAEAAMEFVRICADFGFHNLVLSMKSSNTRNMVFATRLLVDKMEEEGFRYPLHLGVTEAGAGEEGRIKSAVGIGALLTDGIGDTIRVSLTENPENELAPAKKLADRFNIYRQKEPIEQPKSLKDSCIRLESKKTEYSRLESENFEKIGGGQPPVVISRDENVNADYVYNAELASRVTLISGEEKTLIHAERKILQSALSQGDKKPKIFRRAYFGDDKEDISLQAAADFGALLIDGLCDGIFIETPDVDDPDFPVTLSFSILQAARARFSKVEIVSCPSCGRTQYDIVAAVERVREKTAHLTGITIAVMGCIVNGPGEMAGADYGYIGSGKGLVTLFKGKNAVRRNVPQEKAVDALVELIKENGDWKNPIGYTF